MATTFGQANIAFGGALFTFGEFSVAYELSLVTDVGGRYKRKQLYDEMFKKDPVKKNMDKFHKPKTHKDKSKYSRKEKFKPIDEL